MTGAEIAARARSVIGAPIRYELGAGGRNPALSTPAPAGALDCSGLAAWACGYPRGPRNTDWIVRDASGRHEAFDRPLDVQLGDLVIFGGRFATVPVVRRIRPGHVGVVTDVSRIVGPWSGSDEHWAALGVTHCSGSNHRHTPNGSAVAETSGAIWARRGIVVRLR
jgi:hypothetical protein